MNSSVIRTPTVRQIAWLSDLTGEEADVGAISKVGYAVLQGMYPPSLIETINTAAERMIGESESRFLKLGMLRAAHRYIPEVRSLVYSAQRLHHLSRIVGVPLEAYPIDVAASHINYYQAHVVPVDFHSDGAAIVELIPLNLTDSNDGENGTLIYKGPRDRGYAELSAGTFGHHLPTKCAYIAHHSAESILLQGRRLLHAGGLASYDRKLLVIAMRSAVEPWKDDNTIARLAMDYDVSDFLDQWIEDELSRKLPAWKRFIEREGV